MTKKDLKNGMVVETREGERYLVHNNRIIRNDSYLYVNNYNEKLIDKDGDSQYDIMKVYKSDALHLNNIFSDSRLELIWSREDIKVRDKVKVINVGSAYSSYYEWVERNIREAYLRYSYDIKQPIDYGILCEVLYIAKHGGSFSLNADDTLAYVKDLETDRCYLISIDGLEKVN